jgi:hypothetical protein
VSAAQTLRCARSQATVLTSGAMPRLAITLLAALALSLGACAEKPGTKKDDKKDAKDGKAKADGAKADGSKADEKPDAKPDAKPAE